VDVVKKRDRDVVFQREVLQYPYNFIGRSFGVTGQRAHKIVREATEHLNRLELELLKATKTGEAVGLAIPHGNTQEERQDALDYLDWVQHQLSGRGVHVSVDHRPTTEGSVFFLEDVTNYTKNEEEIR
jgi:hypothetical protein